MEDQYLQRVVCGTGRIDELTSGHEIVITDLQAITFRPDLPGVEPFFPDAYRPCEPDVEMPMVKRDVRPNYTRSAMDRGVQGGVLLQVLVAADGTVGGLRVLRPLDPDLDLEAIRAAKEWRFTPGTYKGQPAPVVVTMEMTFELKKK